MVVLAWAPGRSPGPFLHLLPSHLLRQHPSFSKYPLTLQGPGFPGSLLPPKATPQGDDCYFVPSLQPPRRLGPYLWGCHHHPQHSSRCSNPTAGSRRRPVWILPTEHLTSTQRISRNLFLLRTTSGPTSCPLQKHKPRLVETPSPMPRSPPELTRH